MAALALVVQAVAIWRLREVMTLVAILALTASAALIASAAFLFSPGFKCITALLSPLSVMTGPGLVCGAVFVPLYVIVIIWGLVSSVLDARRGKAPKAADDGKQLTEPTAEPSPAGKVGGTNFFDAQPRS